MDASNVVAGYAAVVSTIAVGWQVRREWRTQRHQVDVEASRGLMYLPAGRKFVFVISVRNRGDSPVRVVSAGFDADDGTANSTWVHGQMPVATLPGVVQPRDAGFTYLPEDELGGLNPAEPVVGWAALSTGEQVRTKPITLRSW